MSDNFCNTVLTLNCQLTSDFNINTYSSWCNISSIVVFGRHLFWSLTPSAPLPHYPISLICFLFRRCTARDPSTSETAISDLQSDREVRVYKSHHFYPISQCFAFYDTFELLTFHGTDFNLRLPCLWSTTRATSHKLPSTRMTRRSLSTPTTLRTQ